MSDRDFREVESVYVSKYNDCVRDLDDFENVLLILDDFENVLLILDDFENVLLILEDFESERLYHPIVNCGM